MHHHFSGPYLIFIWMYTLGMTAFCFWCFRFASSQSAAVSSRARGALPSTLLAATLDTISKSMAWISAWAWMIALLCTLPSGGLIQTMISAALLTFCAAAALLAGQRGRGPFAKALEWSGRDGGGGEETLQWLTFCTSWMTAMAWTSAFTACLQAVGVNPVAAAWAVAIATLGVRWSWLWHGTPPSDNASRAFAVYAASPDVALTVGIVVPPSHTQAARSDPRGLPQPLVELLEATVGLSALAGAWVGCVALQGGSSALWATKAWPAHGLSAAVLDVAYAGSLSAASVAVVAYAREAHTTCAMRAAAADAPGEEALALRRVGVLAGETAALAVASGWAWYNALLALAPPLSDRSMLVRTVGALTVTVCAALGMAALKPRPLPNMATVEVAGNYRPPSCGA